MVTAYECEWGAPLTLVWKEGGSDKVVNGCTDVLDGFQCCSWLSDLQGSR